ncbi:MAG: 8-amino-7-oxononanoate synthase [Burkholderiales bacterium]
MTARKFDDAVEATARTPFGRLLEEELNALQAAGLYRTRACLDGKQGARVAVGGRELVSFASNDYLGLAADARIIAAARAGAERYGVGAGASHLLYGHGRAHEELEAALARFTGYPRALCFSTGYLANIGVISALCTREDAVFADKLNHASLNDAMLLSRARFHRYPHLDLDRLEHFLRASRARRKLIVTDAVFSMDGDLAPVPDLVRLCSRYDAFLLLDDAHGFGVLGAHGAGTLSHFAVASERIVYMGTLGKAAGVYGAFVAADAALVDLLVNRARTYIYTTATPPLLAVALLESLEIVRSEDWRREHLARLSAMLVAARPTLPGSLLLSCTAIQPLVLGSAHAATRAMGVLAEYGLVVPAVRPPTVPRGSARLRISLSAAHSVAEVERLLAALRQLPR